VIIDEYHESMTDHELRPAYTKLAQNLGHPSMKYILMSGTMPQTLQPALFESKTFKLIIAGSRTEVTRPHTHTTYPPPYQTLNNKQFIRPHASGMHAFVPTNVQFEVADTSSKDCYKTAAETIISKLTNMRKLHIGKTNKGGNTALVLCLTKDDTEQMATKIKDELTNRELKWGEVSYAHRRDMSALPRYITGEGHKL
jgi:hypothetical protein